MLSRGPKKSLIKQEVVLSPLDYYQVVGEEMVIEALGAGGHLTNKTSSLCF